MSMGVTRKEVLSAYRRLLRSMAVTFKGDQRVHSEAKRYARRRFDEGRKLSPDSETAAMNLAEARGASQFLQQGVIQGVMDENTDTFRMSVVWR